MYNPVFPVTWYDYGDRVVKDEPDILIRDAAGKLVPWNLFGVATDGGGLVIDFGLEGGRATWVKGMTDVVGPGKLDGVFIDGFRGDVQTGHCGPPCSSGNRSHDALWWTGLNTSTTRLRDQLGPNATIIGNYGVSAPDVSGMMIERWGASVENIELLASSSPRLIEVHAQYAARSAETFNRSIAGFLAGMGEGAYFGEGNAWGGEGPTACAAWLKPHAEYTKPLGKPEGPATLVGTVFTRSFSSGTKVMIDSSKNGESCVLWAACHRTVHG